MCGSVLAAGGAAGSAGGQVPGRQLSGIPQAQAQLPSCSAFSGSSVTGDGDPGFGKGQAVRMLEASFLPACALPVIVRVALYSFPFHPAKALLQVTRILCCNHPKLSIRGGTLRAICQSLASAFLKTTVLVQSIPGVLPGQESNDLLPGEETLFPEGTLNFF